ncbi:MAG: TIGR04282 family arsenosugar biosynthesis glycosyltransferase [Gammaproteobacteria bacterium]|nr:TIGR04282 family arsenosugar biosynthesis glycosyltransferase [Gammaproteobacteria bacterium]
MDNRGVLIIFTRTPVPGQTKTRLIPSLGADGAATLHTRILLNTLQEASRSSFSAIQLWCAPVIEHPVFGSCAETFSTAFHLQTGNDLGLRMYNALKHALNEFSFAVIAGSDCPDLNTEILNQAYTALADGQDAVLGPCEDGGYYLIGSRHPEYGIFKDIDWGSETVTETTREKFRTLGWSWLETERLCDIDTMADLIRYEAARHDVVIGLPQVLRTPR